MANDNLFWNQMLMRSDSIVDIDPNAPDATEQVRAQLSTITEQFDRAFDPADQFEEYVAVALCQALQRALTPKVAKPICKVSVQNKLLAPAATPSVNPPSLSEEPSTQPPQKKHQPKNRRGKRK
jgi:hypothetical protein